MINSKRVFFKSLLDIINPYAWVTTARNKAFDFGILNSRKFDIPTICIGNISVGGTGKTPHTEYIVKLLKEKYRIAVLSRGYGRNSHGYIKATDGTAMQQIGDEPFQIKNKFNDICVAVCEKRVTGIENLLADENGIQAILLDDAFQHRYVKAGLNILLIDSNRPVWRDCILPFGRLRESLAGIKRADIVVMTKCDNVAAEEQKWCREYIKKRKDIPVFFSAMQYGALYPVFPKAAKGEATVGTGSKVLLLTGIARPAPLKAEIESRGAEVTLMQYSDHHNFSDKDFNEIAATFDRIEGEKKIVITTEKDATRLLDAQALPQGIKERIFALPIEVKILDGEEKMFNQIIEDYVAKNSRNS